MIAGFSSFLIYTTLALYLFDHIPYQLLYFINGNIYLKNENLGSNNIKRMSFLRHIIFNHRAYGGVSIQRYHNYPYLFANNMYNTRYPHLYQLKLAHRKQRGDPFESKGRSISRAPALHKSPAAKLKSEISCKYPIPGATSARDG